MLTDEHGRQISYLRISLTDRCNLRCFYCWPSKYVRFIPHQEILRYEEIIRLVHIGSSLGVKKVRLTGGEPLVRKDFLSFLEKLHGQCLGVDLRLTTNGTLLPGRVGQLKAMGLSTLNISLDTLHKDKFERITGRALIDQVRTGIDECLEHGLKVKVNAVALKGVNDDELGEFIEFASTNGLEIRFIEFMPIGGKNIWDESHFWSGENILGQAMRLADLRPVDEQEKTNGPARVFRIGDGPGRFGVISGVSGHFCGRCNRLRITANGRLRTCLFSDKEYRLTPLLRSERLGDEQLARVMRLASIKKPLGYLELARHSGQSVCRKNMSAIGG
jgi:GTP 3',8-cyclase